MRNCIRCGAEMKEDFRITSGVGIVIRPAKGLAAVIPKAAVCPQCGEVSIYVEEPDKLIGKENNFYRTDRRREHGNHGSYADAAQRPKVHG